MTLVRWNQFKNLHLKLTRGASFEELLQARRVATRNHPSKPGQKMMFCEHEGHIWVVPFVENEREVFLKTLYRSRKFTKLYKRGLL